MAEPTTDIDEREELRSIDPSATELKINSLLVAIEEEDVPAKLLDLASQLQKALQEKRKKPH